MTRNVVDDVFLHHLGGITTGGAKIEGDVGQRIGLHLDIGLDAATVAYLTSVGRIEHLRQGIGDVLQITAVGVLVVNGLDTAAAGDVILRRGELHLRVIRKVKGRLHKSLSIRART